VHDAPARAVGLAAELEQSGVVAHVRMREEDAVEERRPRVGGDAVLGMTVGERHLLAEIRRGVDEVALARARIDDRSTLAQQRWPQPICGRPPSCAMPSSSA
jgi:hypothetical protein